ncbi:MAG: aminopeptidase [Myxococcales bacterium]|nr:aminopeptidase [Myxococcota bacterium]MDW8280076.1 aminopeptidase [Myxococcales bacterium]
MRLILLLVFLVQPGCFTLRYLARQAVDQLQLLRERRHVRDVLSDPQTDVFLRERLQLALEVRDFGVEVLGLRGGGEFTRFIDRRGAVAYNLTAAYQTRLEVRQWRFPLVGRVPYLGFFSRQAAEQEAQRLQAEGFDTYIRPVGAYSSLGYLLSPIYAAMILEPGPRGELRAVETLLHEMAHTTAWIRSASDLNESYATLVGQRGAALFFAQRGRALPGGEERSPQDAAAEQERNRAFAAWLHEVFRQLRAFYERAEREGWPRAEVLRRREEEFRRIQASYRAAFPPPRYARLASGPLNNAVLLSFAVYHLGNTGEARRRAEEQRRLQEDLLAAVDGDLRRYIALYRRAARRPDGAAWLRQLAGEYRQRTAAYSGNAKVRLAQ